MADRVASSPDMVELGQTLGAKLAVFADQAEEKLRAAGVEPAPRCASCAFRAGTFPNTKAPATGLDALKCLVERHPFGCHHDKEDGLPTRLCGGFVNILMAETGPTLTEAPWPFSDEVGQKPAGVALPRDVASGRLLNGAEHNGMPEASP